MSVYQYGTNKSLFVLEETKGTKGDICSKNINSCVDIINVFN